MFSSGTLSAQTNNLKEYAAKSEFMSEILQNKKYSRKITEAFLRSPDNFKIWGATHPACPTDWWWDNSSGSQKSAQRNLQNNIKKTLKGFPAATIQKCMAIAPIFSNRKPTKHWRNKENFYTNLSAIAIKDLGNGSVYVTKSLVSSNTTAGKKEAILYNETLQSVCKMREINFKKQSAKAECGGLGRGAAIALSKGRETTFSITTRKAVIFAVLGSNVPKAKRKYPDIFK